MLLVYPLHRLSEKSRDCNAGSCSESWAGRDPFRLGTFEVLNSDWRLWGVSPPKKNDLLLLRAFSESVSEWDWLDCLLFDPAKGTCNDMLFRDIVCRVDIARSVIFDVGVVER